MLYNIALISAKQHCKSAIVYICVCIYIYIYLLVYISPSSRCPPTPCPPSCLSRSSQSARLGSACYTAPSFQLSVLHVVVYVCQCYFLHSSHPLLPLLCPQVCSRCLCLHSFPTNRFICIVFHFLDSIHIL